MKEGKVIVKFTHRKYSNFNINVEMYFDILNILVVFYVRER